MAVDLSQIVNDVVNRINITSSIPEDKGQKGSTSQRVALDVEASNKV